MSTDDLEQLAAAAQQRSPGPWHTQPHSHWKTYVEIYAVSDSRYMQLAECGIERATAEFIAACSPDIVLALIARVRELETERAAMKDGAKR